MIYLAALQLFLIHDFCLFVLLPALLAVDNNPFLLVFLCFQDFCISLAILYLVIQSDLLTWSFLCDSFSILLLYLILSVANHWPLLADGGENEGGGRSGYQILLLLNLFELAYL